MSVAGVRVVEFSTKRSGNPVVYRTNNTTNDNKIQRRTTTDHAAFLNYRTFWSWKVIFTFLRRVVHVFTSTSTAAAARGGDDVGNCRHTELFAPDSVHVVDSREQNTGTKSGRLVGCLDSDDMFD